MLWNKLRVFGDYDERIKFISNVFYKMGFQIIMGRIKIDEDYEARVEDVEIKNYKNLTVVTFFSDTFRYILQRMSFKYPTLRFKLYFKVGDVVVNMYYKTGQLSYFKKRSFQLDFCRKD